MKKIFVVLMALSLLLGFTGLVAAGDVSEKAGVGKYLTDDAGKTLYWFKNDSAGKSTCTGGCIQNWPLFFRENVKPAMGTTAGDYGTITREDGQKQSTFRGYPLYYWKGDAKAGDTNGQGMKDVWHVINPDNFPPK